MNAPLATRSWRGDFPGVADWHYLDTAATAQKSQQVVDAIARAYGADYATVHRGVYARSAIMTLAYEAARPLGRGSCVDRVWTSESMLVDAGKFTKKNEKKKMKLYTDN